MIFCAGESTGPSSTQHPRGVDPFASAGSAVQNWRNHPESFLPVQLPPKKGGLRRTPRGACHDVRSFSTGQVSAWAMPVYSDAGHPLLRSWLCKRCQCPADLPPIYLPTNAELGRRQPREWRRQRQHRCQQLLFRRCWGESADGIGTACIPESSAW